MTGTIHSPRALLDAKGFGFILGADGVEYFFHRTAAPDFEGLTFGDPVEFRPTSTEKGPRAEAVRLT